MFYEGSLKTGGMNFSSRTRKWVLPYSSCPTKLKAYRKQNSATYWTLQKLIPSPASLCIPGADPLGQVLLRNSSRHLPQKSSTNNSLAPRLLITEGCNVSALGEQFRACFSFYYFSLLLFFQLFSYFQFF